MSEVEKLILEKLDVLSQDVHEVKEVAMEAKAVAMEANEKAEQARKAALKTQITLENEISRKIDVIGEGHDFLKMKLDTALKYESKSERMELELLSLRMDVNDIKYRLSMAR